MGIIKKGIPGGFSGKVGSVIAGTYPSFQIDYSLALVSRGDLSNALQSCPLHRATFYS